MLSIVFADSSGNFLITDSTKPVLRVNVRSFKAHGSELEALVSSPESPPTVLCLTETWLTRFDVAQHYLVSGYTSFHVKSRENRSGAGVMMRKLDGLYLLEEIDTGIEESMNTDLLKTNLLTKTYKNVITQNGFKTLYPSQVESTMNQLRVQIISSLKIQKIQL